MNLFFWKTKEYENNEDFNMNWLTQWLPKLPLNSQVIEMRFYNYFVFNESTLNIGYV